MDLVISGSSLWGFYITACHCRIQSFSLENDSHRVSEPFLHSSSALYLQPSMREVKDRKPRRCQVSEDGLVPLLLSVTFTMSWLFLLRTRIHISDCSTERCSAGKCCGTVEF